MSEHNQPKTPPPPAKPGDQVAPKPSEKPSGPMNPGGQTPTGNPGQTSGDR